MSNPAPTTTDRLTEFLRPHYAEMLETWWHKEHYIKRAIDHYRGWQAMGHNCESDGASAFVIAATYWHYKNFGRYGTPKQIMHELNKVVKS